MIMDEVYPWEGEYKEISFFDPACGSGIFLVEAYRTENVNVMISGIYH